jgi:toxin ParE1/3/4
MPARNSRFTITPAARADLDGIWQYTAETWSADQAERYTDLIIDAFEAIAAEPDRGRDASRTRAGYRYWTVGRHFVFYRMAEGTPEIVRILHQRRDFVRHL